MIRDLKYTLKVAIISMVATLLIVKACELYDELLLKRHQASYYKMLFEECQGELQNKTK